jgi:uncharacterized protein YbjT (DUF2867 family)
MKITVIGATGQVGMPLVRDLLAHGAQARVLVRDPGKARRLFADRGELEIRDGDLSDAATVRAAFAGVDAGYIALGATGPQRVLQEAVIGAAADAGLPQLVRQSVLSARHDSLGINQRAHAHLDDIVARAGVPHTSVRPALFMTTMLGDTAAQVSQTRTWAGVSQHGRNALIDPRDVAGAASAVLRDSRHWGANLDLTGPKAYSWPDVARALTDELGVPVTFRALDEGSLRAEFTSRGAPAAVADLVLAREAAIEAGENDRVVKNVELLTGRAARTLEAFLHENRAAFAPVAGPAQVS